jgi:hypothetical protein
LQAFLAVLADTGGYHSGRRLLAKSVAEIRHGQRPYLVGSPR